MRTYDGKGHCRAKSHFICFELKFHFPGGKRLFLFARYTLKAVNMLHQIEIEM